jgi:hypothetical protein
VRGATERAIWFCFQICSAVHRLSVLLIQKLPFPSGHPLFADGKGNYLNPAGGEGTEVVDSWTDIEHGHPILARAAIGGMGAQHGEPAADPEDDG